MLHKTVSIVHVVPPNIIGNTQRTDDQKIDDTVDHDENHNDSGDEENEEEYAEVSHNKVYMTGLSMKA